MKVVIVIPAQNEEKYIGAVVAGAKQHGDVIVVDDGSIDETAETAKDAGALVLKLSKNKGKGYALRVGTKKALEGGADVIVFMDGDGQHRAEDIPNFLKKIKDGAEAVFGRRLDGEMPLVKKMGNWGIVNIFKLFFGKEPGDLLCGFKAFTKDALEKIGWKSDGYFVESEIMIRSIGAKLKIKNIGVPIIYHDPKKGTGVMDGLKIGWKMLELKLRG